MVTRMHATEPAPNGTVAIDRSRVAYTVTEAATLLSLSVRKTKALVATGELASAKFGRARRVLGNAIEDYARRNVAEVSR
jgi:excisionase family DNA binding protein